VDAQLEGHARPDRFAGLQHGAELELRCWFRPGPPGSSGDVSQQVDIDQAAVGASDVRGRIDSADQSGVATLRLDFAAVTLNPCGSSSDIAGSCHGTANGHAETQPSLARDRPGDSHVTGS
jgi:hypothetical protein